MPYQLTVSVQHPTHSAVAFATARVACAALPPGRTLKPRPMPLIRGRPAPLAVLTTHLPAVALATPIRRCRPADLRVHTLILVIQWVPRIFTDVAGKDPVWEVDFGRGAVVIVTVSGEGNHEAAEGRAESDVGEGS
ncbi:hypothetical protein Hypma_014811 [Hypsizygus marmoreus]|uniref:Uncharacterized protein n=1 Tax=Hypsizygus marmoreus TaxID=39966 RepID=A0A369KCE4_HYPMA|nr:hypothetical protein Hypma_014811 [Hypsizygus marmoreus]